MKKIIIYISLALIGIIVGVVLISLSNPLRNYSLKRAYKLQPPLFLCGGKIEESSYKILQFQIGYAYNVV